MADFVVNFITELEEVAERVSPNYTAAHFLDFLMLSKIRFGFLTLTSKDYMTPSSNIE